MSIRETRGLTSGINNMTSTWKLKNDRSSGVGMVAARQQQAHVAAGD